MLELKIIDQVEALRASIEQQLTHYLTEANKKAGKGFVATIPIEHGTFFVHQGILYLDHSLSASHWANVTASDSYLFPDEIDPCVCEYEVLASLSTMASELKRLMNSLIQQSPDKKLPECVIWEREDKFTEQELTKIYNRYCEDWKLEPISADDLLFQLDQHQDEARHRKFLTGFIRQWDRCVA